MGRSCCVAHMKRRGETSKGVCQTARLAMCGGPRFILRSRGIQRIAKESEVPPEVRNGRVSGRGEIETLLMGDSGTSYMSEHRF